MRATLPILFLGLLAPLIHGQVVFGPTGSGGGGGGGISTVNVSCGVSGGGSSSTVAVKNSRAINAQTGTTYTYLDSDCGKLVTHSNASAIAGTLPQAGGSGQFVSGWSSTVANVGAGTLTITPTTSTINGVSTLVLLSGQSAIVSSDGTNFSAAVAQNATKVSGTTPGSTGLSVLGGASAGAIQSTLSLVPGTDVQAYDTELACLAGLTSASNKAPYFTGSGTCGLFDYPVSNSGIASSAAIALSKLATQSADTVVMNQTGGSAVPTAVALPTSGTNGCAGSSDALTYNTSSHALGCHSIAGGSSSSVFQGSTASTSSFSATPTFDLANVSSSSPVRFEPAALTANVTSVTFSNPSAGAKFSIAWLQDGTGGRTVAYGMSASNTCPLDTTVNVTTTQQFEVKADGSTIVGVGCGDDNPVPGVTIPGATSGYLRITVPAVAGTNTVKLPAGTTDFTGTGGTSQVVRQSSTGAALTVSQLATTDLTGLGTGVATALAIAPGSSGGVCLVGASGCLKQFGFMLGADDGPALVDTNDQGGIFSNQFGVSLTIAKVWCQTNTGTSTIQLQKDDGTPTNMLSSDLVCSTGTGASTTSFVSGENVMADGDSVNFVVVTAATSGTPQRISLFVRYQ